MNIENVNFQSSQLSFYKRFNWVTLFHEAFVQYCNYITFTNNFHFDQPKKACLPAHMNIHILLQTSTVCSMRRDVYYTGKSL